MPGSLGVLIASAQESDRSILNGLAGSYGYRVWQAASAEQVESFLASQPVAILLADLRLSATPLVFAQQLVRQCPETPIVILGDLADLSLISQAVSLGAHDYLLRPFSDTLVKAALRRAEMVVSNIRTEAQVARQGRQLSALQRATITIAASLDPTTVLTTILAETQHLLNVDGVSVLLLDQDTGELVFRAASNVLQNLDGLRLPPGQGAAQWAVEHQQTLLLNDVAADSRFYPGIDRVVGYTTRNLMAVPLRVADKIIGAIEAVNKRDGSFDGYDLALFESLALAAAAAIRNALYYQESVQGRDLLHAILNSAGDGIAVVDQKGSLIFHNPTASQILGLSEAAGEQNILSLAASYADRIKIHNSANMEFEEYLKNLLATGETERFLVEAALPQKRTFDTLMTAVKFPQGDVHAHLLVWRDVTQEKEMERWREELGHIIVHDLKNPLSLARIGVEAAQMFLPEETNADALQGLSLALQGIGQLERRAEILLAVNQIENGAQVLNVQPVSIAEMVRRAQSFYDFEAHERQVSFDIEISDDLPPIQGDPDMLEWAFGDLIHNAIRHSPSPGSVAIAAKTHEDGVLTTVQDNGPCLSDEVRAHIFDKFQTHVPDARRSTGFKFYFSKLVVDAHGGRIALESAQETGCLFAIWLPFLPPRQPLAAKLQAQLA
jgi:PAS domain S-box-containing protein